MGLKVAKLQMQKFEAQRQNAAARDGIDPCESLEVWLAGQRKEAVVVAESEFASQVASGKPVNKERYEAVLAKKCEHCGTAETASKTLMTCTGCKVANYCDSACQKQAWSKHKAACKRAQQAATTKSSA